MHLPAGTYDSFIYLLYWLGKSGAINISAFPYLYHRTKRRSKTMDGSGM